MTSIWARMDVVKVDDVCLGLNGYAGGGRQVLVLE